MDTIKRLKQLLREGKINKQQFNTYKGQVLSGNEEAALVGMKRKGLM